MMSDPRNVRTAPAAGLASDAGCLPPGYRLHEFVIDSVLGEGGFGVVYEATDTRLERRVAIKEYMPTSLATRDTAFSVHARSSADHQEAFVAGLRSFVNEGKLLARFEHPALVKVYQFWEERGTAYMVMPLYSAPTFKRWIRQRSAPVEETWLLMFLDGLIDALEVLHKENCLHRDVAPDNILVLNDASPLLLDFGAARRVIGDLTHNLTVILKPGFAPVEQYAETSALKQGPWTDVYALAAVGYFAITGKAPVAAVGRMVSDELVPLREYAAGRYSQRLLTALDAGLRVRPEERPLSMQALRAYLFGEAVPDEKTTVIVQKPPGGLSPAPNALHSTFKPKTHGAQDGGNVTDDATTRAMTHAPAGSADRAAPSAAGRSAAAASEGSPLSASPLDAPRPGARAPTISPSAAPTFKLPPKPAVAAAPKPASAPARKSSALLWAGSFAAGGAALVLGAAWLLGGSPSPAPAPSAPPSTPPVAQSAETPPPAVVPPPAPPVVATPPPAASVPSTATMNAPVPAPAPKEAPAPVPAHKAPAQPPAAKVATPAATANIEKKAAPVPPTVKPTPVEPPKTEPTRAEAPKPVDVPKAPPAPPPAPPVVRAPEGPPPLAVTDRGIIDLQIEGSVDTRAKEPIFSAYTCCNLHYSGDWVSDLNYSSETRIPAGTPIKIVDYGRWRVITEVDGKRIRIGLDYGRRQETLAQFARKLTVDKDLRFRMASFPPIVQDAIRVAKVMPGMSKEQVVMAVGFPARHETATVDSAEWKMWHTSRIPYTIRFDERGRVKEIEIVPESRANVVYGVKP